MSGQPLRKPGDAEAFRKEYLSNLGLRASIDDKNLQANKTFLRTGQVPVVPSDFRTLSEKVADVERLKTELKGKLLNITDGVNAQNIIAQLSSNAVVFLYQNWAPIEAKMKSIYTLGVESQIFMDYLEKYIIKFNQTRGVENNLQGDLTDNLVYNTNTILEQMPSQADIRNLNLAVIRGNLYSKRKQAEIDKLFGVVNAQVRAIIDILDIIPQIDNEVDKAQLQELVSGAVQAIPTTDDLESIMGQIAESRENEDVRIEVSEMLESILETVVMNADNIDVAQELAQKSGGGSSSSSARAGIEEEEVEEPLKMESGSESYMDLTDIQKAPIKKLRSYLYYIKERGNKTKNPVYNAFVMKMKEINAGSEAVSKITPKNAKALLSSDEGLALSEMVFGADWKINLSDLSEFKKKGSGVCIKRVFKPVSGNGIKEDLKEGIQQSNRFIPFGRYILNKHQLDKDIVAIKRKCGASIFGLPSTRVSRNLGGILKKFIGGGIPSFEELNKLNEEEKNFLHKVSKESNIMDKISIPTPSRDEEDKLINEFEIQRGQIVAGNDNKELINKFKLNLLKMNQKNLIPKAQVKEILLELAYLN